MKIKSTDLGIENDITLELMKYENLDDIDYRPPYFMSEMDKPTIEEKRKYPDADHVAVLRVPGYTLGVAILNEVSYVIHIDIYERKENVFIKSPAELEKILNNKFVHKMYSIRPTEE